MNIILYKALFWHHLLYIFLKPCRQQAYFLTAAGAKSVQSCPTLCDSIDGSPPGSPFPGILQARTLEWVATAFSNAWKWKVKSLSLVWLFAIQWTVAYQAPQSMGFFRQEYWSGLPLPSPCFELVSYMSIQIKNRESSGSPWICTISYSAAEKR